jgi:hypothetical protein
LCRPVHGSRHFSFVRHGNAELLDVISTALNFLVSYSSQCSNLSAIEALSVKTIDQL